MEANFRKVTKELEDLTKVVRENKAEFGAFEREYIKLQENQKHVKEKIKKQKKANEKVFTPHSTFDNERLGRLKCPLYCF